MRLSLVSGIITMTFSAMLVLSSSLIAQQRVHENGERGANIVTNSSTWERSAGLSVMDR